MFHYILFFGNIIKSVTGTYYFSPLFTNPERTHIQIMGIKFILKRIDGKGIPTRRRITHSTHVSTDIKDIFIFQ